MLNTRRQAFTRCLSSGVVLLLAGFCMGQEREISFGMVLLQTVRIEKTGSAKMTPGIVVRFVNKATSVETFAITGETGFAEVPLRPGIYCYDAYSDKGKGLTMKRAAADRCFEVKASEDLEVGVEFLK
jgi:hypothetical protein